MEYLVGFGAIACAYVPLFVLGYRIRSEGDGAFSLCFGYGLQAIALFVGIGLAVILTHLAALQFLGSN